MIQNLTPAQIAEGLAADEIILIDVREPHEFAAARITGSLNFPLSGFDPLALPDPGSKALVMMCAGGVRSVRALEACHMAGLDLNSHLAGGINAWYAQGFPIES